MAYQLVLLETNHSKDADIDIQTKTVSLVGSNNHKASNTGIVLFTEIGLEGAFDFCSSIARHTLALGFGPQYLKDLEGDQN